MNIKNLLVMAFAASVVAGCKLQIDVPEGGRVVNENGDFVCEAGESCSIDVNDTNFDELYIAEPADGMEFTGWVKQHKGFCGSNKLRMKPCHMYTTNHGGSDILMSFLEKDQVFFLTPSFAPAASEGYPTCEYTRTTPGGSFHVCNTGLSESECMAEDQGVYDAMGNCADNRDDEPAGYCSTDDGDVYYYDHDNAGTPEEFGTIAWACDSFEGEWVPL